MRRERGKKKGEEEAIGGKKVAAEKPKMEFEWLKKNIKGASMSFCSFKCTELYVRMYRYVMYEYIVHVPYYFVIWYSRISIWERTLIQ